VVVSVFALSTENLKRPQAEVNHILNLLRDYIGSYRERAENEGIRVRVMGDLTALPADIREAAARTIAQTAHGTRGTFNIGINYGSRDELCAACNALIKEGKPVVTPADLEAHLYTDGLPPLDLLIRPGGCVRLSNFMLFQAAYAELYFCDTLWPDFSEQDLDTAFAAFAARERRFGVRPEKRSKI
jgi:undecaprenyl diphosphate synthase